MMDSPDPSDLFGQIDIYLLDQILRRNIRPGMRIMDVGCGHGRNLTYLMRAGYDVSGLDRHPSAIEDIRHRARQLAPHLPETAFRAESIEASSFADACADVVICNAVFHFARDHQHFEAELEGAWRLLAPGGLFFARLASMIGIENQVMPKGDGRFAQPDGSVAYLVDLDQLLAAGAHLGAQQVDPIKTTNVQGMRCMTTWVLRKP